MKRTDAVRNWCRNRGEIIEAIVKEIKIDIAQRIVIGLNSKWLAKGFSLGIVVLFVAFIVAIHYHRWDIAFAVTIMDGILTVSAAWMGPGILRGIIYQAVLLVMVFVLTAQFTAIVNGKEDYDIEYFKGMASLVPILFLAFVVEQRAAFQSTPSIGNMARRQLVVALILFQVLSGGFVFRVLAANDAHLGQGTPSIINGTVVATVIMIVLTIVAPPLAVTKPSHPHASVDH